MNLKEALQSGAGEPRLHNFKTGNIQNTDRTNVSPGEEYRGTGMLA